MVAGGRSPDFRADQSRLYDYGAAPGYSTPGNQPVDVAPIAGDFNSSQDHAAFRGILDTGLNDAARLTGQSSPTGPGRPDRGARWRRCAAGSDRRGA